LLVGMPGDSSVYRKRAAGMTSGREECLAQLTALCAYVGSSCARIRSM